jgi:hypothetical protein
MFEKASFYHGWAALAPDQNVASSVKDNPSYPSEQANNPRSSEADEGEGQVDLGNQRG